MSSPKRCRIICAESLSAAELSRADKACDGAALCEADFTMIPPSTLFLTSTDTTVGFLSQDPAILDRAKGRPAGMPYLRVLPSLSALRERTRVPRSHRRRLRRAVHTTFIFPGGDAYRIVRDLRHLLLLERLGWAYSSSANPSGGAYDEAFARSCADIVVEPLRLARPPSSIYRLGRHKIRKIR